MTQQDFDVLSEKYLSNKCSSEEIIFLEKWANFNQENGVKINVNSNTLENKKLEQNLWLKIKKDASIKTFALWTTFKWAAASLAASVIVTVGCYYLLNPVKELVVASKINTPNGIESTNIAEKQQEITLPDNSIVILEKNASIITDENYGKINRKVYLKGEAFFKVIRNTKKPFLVYSGTLVTEVLGTSFRIKPRLNNKTIEVSVKTGKVSVYASEIKKTGKLNGVILTPNQKVIYDTESKTISQSIIDQPLIIDEAFEKSSFQFDETKLENIIQIFQQTYGVDIVVSNPSLTQCEFTGDLNELTLFKQLDFLCGSVNAHYELRGSTVFIMGNGCANTNNY